ncbi:MAG: NAD-dependent epimerase/dehydratase family protein [Candidatus Micrarchaeia archaeon]
MKILVTGSLGFIGSNIAERLVREGHEVTALDNMHTGKEENIQAIKGRVKIVKMDSGDISKLDGSFDAIIHEGVYSSSPMYKENPLLTAKVLGEWIAILEYVRKHDARLVFASSSSLYNGHDPPHQEDMDIKVTDFYTEGRYAMERVAKLYNDLYSVRSVGLRYFSVYGPHERSKGKYANLITQFLWDIQSGRQPVILGDGSQTRDFIFVDDVVEANVLALGYKKHDIFNVGTGKSVSLNDVVSLLNRKLGTDIKPRYEQNRIKNYVAHTRADTSRSSSLLGFRATVGLDEGVSRLIKCYS